VQLNSTALQPIAVKGITAIFLQSVHNVPFQQAFTKPVIGVLNHALLLKNLDVWIKVLLLLFLFVA